MEIPINELTIFLSCNSTLAINAMAARMSNNFANHMLGSVILDARSMRKRVGLATNGPLSDVVRPFVTLRSITKFRIQSTYAA